MLTGWLLFSGFVFLCGLLLGMGVNASKSDKLARDLKNLQAERDAGVQEFIRMCECRNRRDLEIDAESDGRLACEDELARLRKDAKADVFAFEFLENRLIEHCSKMLQMAHEKELLGKELASLIQSNKAAARRRVDHQAAVNALIYEEFQRIAHDLDAEATGRLACEDEIQKLRTKFFFACDVGDTLAKIATALQSQVLADQQEFKQREFYLENQVDELVNQVHVLQEELDGSIEDDDEDQEQPAHECTCDLPGMNRIYCTCLNEACRRIHAPSSFAITIS